MGPHSNPLCVLRYLLPILGLCIFVYVADRVDGQSVKSPGLDETSQAVFLPTPREVVELPGRHLEEKTGNREDTAGHDQDREQDHLEEEDPHSPHDQDGNGEYEDKEKHSSERDSDEVALPGSDVKSEQDAPRAVSVTPECLRYHNLFRSDQLGANALPPLYSHTGMDRYVLALMERVAASNCTRKSVPRDIPFGVNFYASTERRPSCPRATHMWYRGFETFGGRYPGTEWSRASGRQFIQMMWSRSEYVACARTENCTHGMNELVCLYYPPGNDVREAPMSKETWNAILLRHKLWLDYGNPGGRRDPPRDSSSEEQRADNEE